MAIKIPVFLSAPSAINAAQQEVYDFVSASLNEENLQPRSLGRSDFPQTDPITEVYYLVRASYGGIILGFTQVEVSKAVIKPGTPFEANLTSQMSLPTPWNQIEAGILHALRKPIIVFCQMGVTGGIFDQGAVTGFLQQFDPAAMGVHDWEQIRERVRIWSADVRKAFRS